MWEDLIKKSQKNLKIYSKVKKNSVSEMDPKLVGKVKLRAFGMKAALKPLVAVVEYIRQK